MVRYYIGLNDKAASLLKNCRSRWLKEFWDSY